MPGMTRMRDTGTATAVSVAMQMPMAGGPLRIPMQRSGSGTSWVPDASQMRAIVSAIGGWNVMVHGDVFVQYDDQQNPAGTHRGGKQLGSVNWAMIAGSRTLAGGALNLRGMFSAEPFTVGSRGYPLLLQSGEDYNGHVLHDRQHPHDLFMELAALYDRPVSDKLVISLYAAPVGEPAIGPVAFPHRPSAASDPFAPISHHWQDATHISFGVITAGVYTRAVKIEGSIFNGREPDQIRTNFDYEGRSFDSYAGRLTVNPDSSWTLSGSCAFLKSPEQLEPQTSAHGIVAAAMYVRPVGIAGSWASSLIYGANKFSGDATLWNSVLAETNVDLGNRNTCFGRAELVQKSDADLAISGDVLGTSPTVGSSPYVSAEQYALTGTVAPRVFSVAETTVGYVRELSARAHGGIGLEWQRQ